MEKNQSLALQKQEQKLSVIGEFQQALKSAKISVENDIRLIETLKIIMLKLGIREANLPSNAEKVVLISHIRENYSMHTLMEIKLAFDLAIAGKLECEADHYENFSCLYFSKIMKAYREWSGRTYKELPQEKPKELPAPVEVITDEQRIADAKEIYLSTKNPLFIPVKIWELIKDSVTLSEQQKSDTKRRAAVMVAEMAKDDKFLFKDKTEQQWINRVTKQLAVAVWWGMG